MAAAEMFDELRGGTIYASQAEAEQWLREHPGDDITRGIVEGRDNGFNTELAPLRYH